jgi:GTPase SAR1 family protein
LETLIDSLFELALWDTAGHQEYGRWPTRLYAPEVRHFCGNVPFLLIGCKKDQRFNRRAIEFLEWAGYRFVTMGEAVVAKIDAAKYLELTGEDVAEVFENAVRHSRYLVQQLRP